MKALTLLVTLLCLATSASAQVNSGSSRFWGADAFMSSGGNVLSNRDFTICLIPAFGEMAGQEDYDAEGGKFSCPVAEGLCTGASCIKSPYCDISWRNTGQVLLSNLAYDLTGQWNKIDYSKIHGPDTYAKSRRANAPDHDKCGVIVSLGDMANITSSDNNIAGDAGNETIETSTIASLAASDLDYQRQAVLAFWGIIKASGIPYIPMQGNNDPWIWFPDLLTKTGFESESWFYTKEATYGRSLAILVPLWGAKKLCVISSSFDFTSDGAGKRTQYSTWLQATVGCGANHPTLLATHDQVSATTGQPGTGAAPVIGFGADPGIAGMSEIFMFAGSHIGDIGAGSLKTSFTGLFGADANQTVFSYFTSFVDSQRHIDNLDGSGYTTSDFAGGAYTVVSLQPDRARICAHDWGTYFQSTTSFTAPGEGVYSVPTANCLAFAFDTRFP